MQKRNNDEDSTARNNWNAEAKENQQLGREVDGWNTSYNDTQGCKWASRHWQRRSFESSIWTDASSSFSQVPLVFHPHR